MKPGLGWDAKLQIKKMSTLFVSEFFCLSQFKEKNGNRSIRIILSARFLKLRFLKVHSKGALECEFHKLHVPRHLREKYLLSVC